MTHFTVWTDRRSSESSPFLLFYVLSLTLVLLETGGTLDPLRKFGRPGV